MKIAITKLTIILLAICGLTQISLAEGTRGGDLPLGTISATGQALILGKEKNLSHTQIHLTGEGAAFLYSRLNLVEQPALEPLAANYTVFKIGKRIQCMKVVSEGLTEVSCDLRVSQDGDVE